MPTVTITLSADAFRTLRQAVQVRALGQNLHGAIDNFACRVVEAVDHGETSITLKTRAEREKERGT